MRLTALSALLMFACSSEQGLTIRVVTAQEAGPGTGGSPGQDSAVGVSGTSGRLGEAGTAGAPVEGGAGSDAPTEAVAALDAAQAESAVDSQVPVDAGYEAPWHDPCPTIPSGTPSNMIHDCDGICGPASGSCSTGCPSYSTAVSGVYFVFSNVPRVGCDPRRQLNLPVASGKCAKLSAEPGSGFSLSGSFSPPTQGCIVVSSWRPSSGGYVEQTISASVPISNGWVYYEYADVSVPGFTCPLSC